MNLTAYHKSLELLHRVATPNGFIASAENTSNYQRVWARDGVICGLAALASGDEVLIKIFEKTIETLAKSQHEIGTIPSNVLIVDDKKEISYGGLAGRVDAVTWFIIGVCQYAIQLQKPEFVDQYKTEIEKGLALLNAWEFNNKHLVYVPLSGNWADEYITDGYVLYDQLLRIWALKSYNYFLKSDVLNDKIESITKQVEVNFIPNSNGEKFHEVAFNKVEIKHFMPCSFSPSGYKNQFDAFANSLVVLLNIGDFDFQKSIINHALSIANDTTLEMVPAFWPPIFEKDEHWNLLKDNCKYEFRNYPYEFHNGGSWSMVNGFFGLALISSNHKKEAEHLLEKINEANAVKEYSFYENFNTNTTEPNGVAFCAWSAAASILVHQTLYANFKIVI